MWEREGRSSAWLELDKQSSELIARRAEVYMDTQRAKFLGPDVARNLYKNVRDLFLGSGDKEVSEKLADHFTAISSEFEGIREVPEAPSSPLPHLTEAEVENRVIEFRHFAKSHT